VKFNKLKYHVYVSPSLQKRAKEKTLTEKDVAFLTKYFGEVQDESKSETPSEKM
jgi:hypothetical protein